MKNVDYEQLTDDAVKQLIKNHLAWSGSDKEMPSRDMDNVRSRFIQDCWKAGYTVDEWNLMNEEEQKECIAVWNRKFDEAAAEADFKWEQAKAMLGL